MLTLHQMPASVSPAVVIVLEELGVPYHTHLVDFAQTAQRSATHLALNPKGRVPVLETPDGVLTEVGAILDWLAATHGPHLVPADPFEAARMRETMYYVAATMHVAHAHLRRGARWADRPDSHADMAAKVPQTMTDCCAYLENHLDLAPFAVGQAFTLADAHLFSILRLAPADGVDMARFPKLAAHLAMMWDRPSARSAIAKGLLT